MDYSLSNIFIFPYYPLFKPILQQSHSNDTAIVPLMLLNNVVERETFIIAINNVFVIITILFNLGTIIISFSSTQKKSADFYAH